MVGSVLHRVVPVVHSRTWTCPKLSAGDAVRAPVAAGTANGVTHQISSFSMGRTHGQVYKTGLGEEPTNSGKAPCRSLQSRVAPCGTRHGDLGFSRLCHRHMNCSCPQEMRGETGSGKRLSLRVNKRSDNRSFGHLS